MKKVICEELVLCHQFYAGIVGKRCLIIQRDVVYGVQIKRTIWTGPETKSAATAQQQQRKAI